MATLTVVGRTKELINRGGEKISPYEVEKALLLHPSVKEAVAFSVPHPRLGENVAAAVVLKPESNPPISDIKTFLADHLAPFKIPQHVLVVPQLPKGATGKISRSELAGYCNGGVLAWEIAHQLESLGRKLECVVLIDTLSFNARAIWARVKQRVYYGPYFRAISNYLPPKLKCEIVAVVSDESQGLNVFSPIPWRSLARKIRGGEFTTIPWRRLARRVYRRYEYSTSPWRRLARKVHRKHVAGTHVGAITTHVGELALLLDDLLRDGPIFDRPATTP